MRDQIPLHRPLFGVEPSGHHFISNSRANYEEWRITSVFSDIFTFPPRSVVKNSDTFGVEEFGSKPVIFE